MTYEPSKAEIEAALDAYYSDRGWRSWPHSGDVDDRMRDALIAGAKARGPASPFAWASVNQVRGTSVVNGGTMLLADDGHCIGHVTVLNAESHVVRNDVARALADAAIRGGVVPAQEWADEKADAMRLRVHLEDATREAVEAEARAERAESRVADLEAAYMALIRVAASKDKAREDAEAELSAVSAANLISEAAEMEGKRAVAFIREAAISQAKRVIANAKRRVR